MKRKFYAYACCAFALAGTTFITSCSDTEDFAVKSFTTEYSSYTEGDVLNFTITLSNDKKYDVVSCIINDKSYSSVSEVGLTKEKYKVTTDLTYESTTAYTLKEITYVDSNSNSHSLAVNKKASAYAAVNTKGDVQVKSLSLESKENDSVYVGDTLEATVELDKIAKNVVIYGFYIEFTGLDGNTETKKVNIIDDEKSNTYKFDVEMPEMAGSITAKITDIDYAKNTEFKSLTNIASTPCAFTASVHEMKVIKASVSASSALPTDVNNKSYFDSSSEITLNLTLQNESNLDVSRICVSGQTVDINTKNANEYKKRNQLQQIEITKKISLNNVSSPTKLTLDSITYTENGTARTIGQTLLDEDYYYYDKIIKSASDFDKMKVDTTTKKITGRYILANDITLTGSEKYLFDNYTMDGTIEFNGHMVSSNKTYQKPMFEKISENGCVQNLTVGYGTMDSSAICEMNYGDIENIKLVNTVYVTTSSSVDNLVTAPALCETNSVSGKIKNVEFASILEGNKSCFSLIGNNYGDVRNVVINPNSIALANNILLALPEANYGTVSSVAVLVEKWFNGLTADDASKQNTLLLAYTPEATYKNIVVNSNFNEQANTLEQLRVGTNATSKNGIFKILDEIEEPVDPVKNAIKALSLFEYSLDSWNTFSVVAESTDIISCVKEYSKNDLNTNATTSFGFISYSEDGGTGNNYFWRNNGGILTINFSIK